MNQTITNDFDAYVFDMDGTLLDTLPDLVVVTNQALKDYGFPNHTQEEILGMVGYGARVLMQRALPEGSSDELIDEVLTHWKAIYPDFGHKLTQPYDGVVEALQALRDAGKKTGVLSNKYHAGVCELAEIYFPGLFDIVQGEGPVPRKPDPAGLIHVLKELDVDPSRCAYFGDSETDMKAANSAGAYAVGVSWGYQPVSLLEVTGSRVIINNPSQIVEIKHKD